MSVAITSITLTVSSDEDFSEDVDGRDEPMR